MAGEPSGAAREIALSGQRHPRFAAEVSEIVAGRMEAAGWRVARLKDGDPAALDAPRLVLLGNLRSFPRYRRLLRERPERPYTVAWQFDPLPPEVMPRLAERTGVAAARLSDVLARQRRVAGIQWSRPLQRGLPWLGFQLSALLTRPRLPGLPVHVKDLRGALRVWASVQEALADGWVDAFFGSTGGTVGFLRSRGVACELAPVAWAPGFGEDRQGKRDIDVLFLGSLSRRRRRRWLALRRRLEAEGLRVEEVAGGCYDEERTQLLNRTRLLVHLHRISWDTPWIRWGLATSCGVAIASEPLRRSEPMRPGIDQIEAPLEELAEAIATRLRDPEGTAAMVASCRERLAAHLSIDTSLERILASGPAP